MKTVILAGLLLATVCSVCFGELCTPDQWEGAEGSTGCYDYHGHPGAIMEYNTISYDAKKQRKASFMDYVNNGRKSKFQIVVRYGDDGNDDEGKAYIVNLRRGKCWTKTLRKPFRKACIPEDAKHGYDFNLGLAGKGGLAVSTYIVRKWEMEVTVTVSKIGNNTIIPVGENVKGKFYWKHLAFMSNIGYINITPGIKNETIFDIPSACKEEIEMEEELPEGLMKEHLVLGF